MACAKNHMQNATPKSTLRPAFYMRVSLRGGKPRGEGWWAGKKIANNASTRDSLEPKWRLIACNQELTFAYDPGRVRRRTHPPS